MQFRIDTFLEMTISILAVVIVLVLIHASSALTGPSPPHRTQRDEGPEHQWASGVLRQLTERQTMNYRPIIGNYRYFILHLRIKLY